MLTLQLTYKDIKELPHDVAVLEDIILKVVVERRRPNCYLCGQGGHIKIQPQIEMTTKEFQQDCKDIMEVAGLPEEKKK